MVAGPWLRVLVVAALVVVAVLGSWEWGAREQGFSPHVLDNPQSWALHRAKVGPDSVVIIGSSQALADFDPPLLARALGRDVVQLAISAASVLPQLERLADDDSVRGLVIADVSPRTMFDRRLRREKKANSVLEAYEQAKVSPAKRADTFLAGAFDSTFVFRNPALAPNRVSLLWGEKWPKQQSVTIDGNRRRYYDYDHTNLRKRIQNNARNSRADRPGNRASQDLVVARVRAAVQKIQARGGRVVLVRMPITGRMARYEARYFPRAKFWDRLVREAGATATIHFHDHASLRDFRPPDGLHLDFHDAPAFTAAFAKVLVKKLRAAKKKKKKRRKKKRPRRKKKPAPPRAPPAEGPVRPSSSSLAPSSTEASRRDRAPLRGPGLQGPVRPRLGGRFDGLKIPTRGRPMVRPPAER